MLHFMEMKATASQLVAVIGDIVGSRRQSSRASAQKQLIAALERANSLVQAEQPLAPTIGDEFQGVYDTVAPALLAALVVRLALPAGMDVRVGIGRGELEVVGTSDWGLTQDGPAWWAARDGIIAVKDAERRHRGLRTWLHEGTTINAYLLARDHLVSGLDERQRRILLGLIEGHSQRQIAEEEGISPSAVSQAIRRQGLAAVLDGLELIS